MEIETTKREKKIALASNYTDEQVAIIKKTVAKNTTDTELTFFLMVCKSVKLNPLNKEIWCYKDNKNNLIVFAGRDGFLKAAQNSDKWNGIASSEIRENDLFEIDIPCGIVKHKHNFKDRGKLLGAYAICKPKECEITTIETADFQTYNREFNVWKSHPADMIKKVAETKVLKKAYGITGLQSEYDFDVNDDKIYPIDTEEKVEDRKKIFIENLINSSTLNPKLKENYLQEISRKDITDSQLNEIIDDLTKMQHEPIEAGKNYNQEDIQNKLDLKMDDEKA